MLTLSTPYVFAMNEYVYGAGQISQSDIAVLEKENIAAVLNLKADHELPNPDQQAQWFTNSTIKYQRYPMSTIEDFNDNAVAFLDAFLSGFAKDNQKVLIHCGTSNRVGALFALYANQKLAYSKDKALQLGEQMGMSSLKAAIEQLL